jgi:hypothetical protein
MASDREGLSSYLVPALHPPEYGGQSRYERDNRHYVAHRCDLRRRVSNFALFIQVVQTGHPLFVTPTFHRSLALMLILGRPIGILRGRAVFEPSLSVSSYLSANFKRRTLVNGSALSASKRTSLARSSINSLNRPGFAGGQLV